MSPNLYTIYLYILLSYHNYNTCSLICESTEPTKIQAMFLDPRIPETVAYTDAIWFSRRAGAHQGNWQPQFPRIIVSLS
jgi:hypothetical protein